MVANDHDRRGGAGVFLLLVLAVLGFVNVTMMTNPRLLLAMSEDDVLPAFIARRSPKTGAPTVAFSLFCRPRPDLALRRPHH